MSQLLEELARAIENPNGGTIGRFAAAERVLQGFVVIPLSDLPKVQRSSHDDNTYVTDGQSIVYTSESNARDWCLRDVAVWQFIANEDVKLRVRRDELAREMVKDGAYAYRFAEDPLQRAIDRIIALEQAPK